MVVPEKLVKVNNELSDNRIVINFINKHFFVELECVKRKLFVIIDMIVEINSGEFFDFEINAFKVFVTKKQLVDGVIISFGKFRKKF